MPHRYICALFLMLAACKPKSMITPQAVAPSQPHSKRDRINKGAAEAEAKAQAVRIGPVFNLTSVPLLEEDDRDESLNLADTGEKVAPLPPIQMEVDQMTGASGVSLGVRVYVPFAADFGEIVACADDQPTCWANPLGRKLFLSGLRPGITPDLVASATHTDTSIDTGSVVSSDRGEAGYPYGLYHETIIPLASSARVKEVRVRSGRFMLSANQVELRWTNPPLVQAFEFTPTLPASPPEDVLLAISAKEFDISMKAIDFKKSYIAFAYALNRCVAGGGANPLTKEKIEQIQAAIDAPAEEYLSWAYGQDYWAELARQREERRKQRREEHAQTLGGIFAFALGAVGGAAGFVGAKSAGMGTVGKGVSAVLGAAAGAVVGWIAGNALGGGNPGGGLWLAAPVACTEATTAATDLETRKAQVEAARASFHAYLCEKKLALRFPCISQRN